MNVQQYDIASVIRICETSFLPHSNDMFPSWSLQAYNRVLAECGGWLDREFNDQRKLDSKKVIDSALIAAHLIGNSRKLLIDEGYPDTEVAQCSHAFLYEYIRARLELSDLQWLASNNVSAALAIILLSPFHDAYITLKNTDPTRVSGNDLARIIAAQACLATAQECHAMMTRDTFVAQQNSLEAVGERRVIDFQLSEMALKAKQREGGKKATRKASLKKAKMLVAGRQILRELILRDTDYQLMTGRSAEIIREAVSQNWEEIGLSGPNDIPTEKWFRESIINVIPEARYMSGKTGKEHYKSSALFHSLLKCAGELYLPHKYL